MRKDIKSDVGAGAGGGDGGNGCSGAGGVKSAFSIYAACWLPLALARAMQHFDKY